MSDQLNPALKALYAKLGATSAVFDYLAASPFATSLFNGFANDIRRWSGVAEDKWIVGGEVDPTITKFLERTSGSSAYATTVSLGFGQEGRGIKIGDAFFAELTSPVEGTRMWAEMHAATVLVHEMQHATGSIKDVEDFVSATDFLNMRSLGEGRSIAAEYLFIMDLLQAQKIQYSQLLTTLPFVTVLGSKFDPDPTASLAFRDNLVAQWRAIYDGLKSAGASNEAIMADLAPRMGFINQNYANPSTSPSETYGQYDLKRFLGVRLGMPTKDGSYDWLPTVPKNLTIDDQGSWIIDWILPSESGKPAERWTISGGPSVLVARKSIAQDDGAGGVRWIPQRGEVTYGTARERESGAWGTLRGILGFAPATENDNQTIDFKIGLNPVGEPIIVGISQQNGVPVSRPELDRALAGMSITLDTASQLYVGQSPDGVWKVSLGGSAGRTIIGTISIGDDRSSVAEWTENGSSVRMTYGSDGQLFGKSVEVVDSAYRTTTSFFDGAGNLVRQSVLQRALDGSYSITTTQANGDVRRALFDSSGNVQSEETISAGSQAITAAVGQLASFLGLIQAIQSGKPLPLITSGVNVAAAVSGNSTLSGVSSGLGSLASLYNLNRALQQGDTLAAVTAGANALSLGLNAYTSLFSQTAGATAVGQAIGSLSTPISSSLPGGTPLAYLNLVNDIAHGNAVGIIADIAAIAFPPAAPFIMIAQIIYSLAQGTPNPWGQARFVFDESGNVTLKILGDDGGEDLVRSQAQALLDGLKQYVATANAAGLDLGLIPQRLSGIGFGDSIWTLNRIDEVTGADGTIRYLDGHALDVPLASPEYFRTLGEQFIYDVVAREAVAAKWEVDTARLQTANGDPMAGLTELQRAQKNGKLARLLPAGAADQTFRPVVLDLNGDGIQTISRENSGVAFDVDDSGFLKHTAWAGATEGLLVIDRNSNGTVDGGSELFSNSKVDTSVRGLAGMGWLDANQDGRIGIDDPVFSQLRVWADANSDGVVQQGEAKSLSDLGISSLNYRLGTFVRDGVALQMGSPDLTADTAGTSAHFVTGGIVVQSSNGQTSLIVSKVNDLGTAPGGGNPGGGDPGNPGGGAPGNPGGGTGIAMGDDGISGPEILEDRELQILAGDLLANDRINGDAGPSLSLVEVGNARHGTVSLVNGVVHFTPDHDYFGGDAGFSYTARNVAGVIGQANVLIDLAPVNDAPVAGGQGNILRDLYGFGGFDEGDLYRDIAYPRFHPGFWREAQYDNSRGYGWHDTPIVTGYPDPFNGKLTVTDVDDSAFTFRIKNQAQFGTASIDNEGNWHFELSNPQGAMDAFQVEITDAHGGKTVKTITVDVPGVMMDVGAPIVLDLDGNGASLKSLAESQAHYDMTGDGLRHRTGWVDSSDGLLAYDANGDGDISGQKELSFKGYKPGAQTDLEGLAAFDTDNDGRITAGDIGWSRFKVWRDLNGDGISGVGELVSLDAAGVASISLQSDRQFATQDGNTIHGKSGLTFTDGRQSSAYDVAFAVSDAVQIVRADGTVETVNRPPSSSDAEVLGTEVADTLIGHVGNDYLRGLGGNDFIFDDEGKDVVEAGAGDDSVMTGVNDDVAIAGSGNDAVMAGAGNDLVFGEDGDDALLGEDGNDILFGGAGNDLVSGGVGNDVLSGDDGDDVITGEQGNDALFGGKGADQLMGNEGDDRLQGDGGDDLLDGGAGNDALIGGTGNDRYMVDAVGDTITEQAGEGWDQVGSSAEAYTLADNLEELTLRDGALRGTGNALDNVLTGNALANVLEGGLGADVIDGGLGADTLIGGQGNDVYVVDNPGDVVVEQWGGGIDTVRAAVDYVLSNQVDNLVMTGYAPLSGTGNDLDNHLTGNDAANLLDGGLGADTLEGGRGDDTYVVDQWSDQVIERSGEGLDTVAAGIDYTLGDAVENLIITGYATSGTGNSLDNTLRANDNGNTLAGGAGADLLIGGKGRDTLDGGTGADILRGGQGNDTYVVDNVDDVVDEMANGDPVLLKTIRTLKNQIGWVQGGAAMVDAMTDYIAAHPGQLIDVPMLAEQFRDMEAAWIIEWNQDWFTPLLTLDYASGSRQDGGKDTVVASFDYTLGANLENLTLTDGALAGTGNALNNKLVGTGGNNVLDGSSGADFMVGGEGDDLYFVDSADDRVLEADAFDKPWSYGLRDMTQIFKSAVSEDWWPALIDERMGQVQASLEAAYEQGATSIWETDVSSILMEFYSAQYSSLLDEPLPYFTDFLSMSWGDPRLMGGHDTVHASTSYVADAGVEDVMLTGTAVAATGNQLDNLLTGNELENLLDGGSGNDTIIGGLGNDVMMGGDGDDFFEWKDGDGLDAISDLSGFDVLGFGGALSAESFDYVTEEVDGRLRTTLIRLDAEGNATAEGVQLEGGASTGFEVEEIRFADGATQGVQALLDAIDARKQPAGMDFFGTSGDDTFYMRDGAPDLVNRYHGGLGYDRILGGWGPDVLRVSSDMRSLDGIELIDGLDTYAYSSFIAGSEGHDAWNFSGMTVRGFVIAPGDGDDEVIGTGGHDLIQGGKGADTLYGGAGDDTFFLSPGDYEIDHFDGGTGANRLYADWGAKVLRVGTTLGSLVNIQRIESVDQNFGAARIVSTDESDMLDFTGITVKNFMIDTGDGNDVVVGGDGDDWIRGGRGVDTLSGGAGNDNFVLTEGDYAIDLFDGGAGVNAIRGRFGSDVLRVDNHLANLRNIQEIAGENPNQMASRILGSSGDDTLDFSGIKIRNFAIDGGDGNDVITGSAESNVIHGGKGDDLLAGGGGGDLYLWERGDGNDHISDAQGDNMLDLGSYVDPAKVTVATTESGWQLQVRHDGQMSLLTIDRFQASTMKVRISSNTWSIDSLPAGDYVTPWDAASGGTAMAKGAGWASMESGDSQRLESEHPSNGLIGGGATPRRSTAL